MWRIPPKRRELSTQKKESIAELLCDLGGTRTPTSFTSYAPQTYAYTNSATGPTFTLLRLSPRQRGRKYQKKSALFRRYRSLFLLSSVHCRSLSMEKFRFCKPINGYG